MSITDLSTADLGNTDHGAKGLAGTDLASLSAAEKRALLAERPVSYTHLTLPTN